MNNVLLFFGERHEEVVRTFSEFNFLCNGDIFEK